MEFSELCELIEECGFEARSYSGRSMHGKTCLAIDGDNVRNVELTLVQTYLENCPTDSDSIQVAMDLCEQLKDSKTDSMGRGEIVYWPSIRWEEAEFAGDESMSDLDG